MRESEHSLDHDIADTGAPQGSFVTPQEIIKRRHKKSKDRAEGLNPDESDNTILVTSMSTASSSLKDAYNVLPPASGETINVTDSSDAQMEESKLLNDEVPDDSIYDNPIQLQG